MEAKYQGICPKCGSKDRFSLFRNEYGEIEIQCNKCGLNIEIPNLDYEIGKGD